MLSVLSCDQPHVPLPRRIRPSPLRHHNQPVTKANQIQDVHEQPGQPSKTARQPEPPEIGDRRSATNRRHIAEVPVPKGPALFGLPGLFDVVRNTEGLLNGHRRHAR